MRVNKIILLGALITVGAIVLKRIRSSIPKGAIAIKSFDVEKYMGHWYEIARMGYYFERNVKHATADYSLNKDGTITVINRGYDIKKHRFRECLGKAKFIGNSEEGRLPFYSAYNIIAVDENYKYALVAGHNHNFLWLLSREVLIPTDIKQNYLAIAKEMGFNTDKLIYTA